MRKAARPALPALALALLGVSFTLVLALAGCSSSPAATASTALRPGYPASLTKSVAKTETEHYAGVIAALVPAVDVASTDNAEKLVSGTTSGGSYYAIIRTVSVKAGVDALKEAAAIKKQLVAGGWIAHAQATESNQYLAALASSKSKKTAWFLELGANDITGQAPTITIQIGSPDLPGN